MEEELKESRGKKILFTVLSVVLTVVIVFAVMQTMMQRAYRTRLQNMMERSFYELVSGMDDLEVKLNKLTVSDGARQDVLLLSEVYRQADSAARDLAALNGGGQSMEEVLAFVNRLSEYSGVLMRKVAQGQQISAEEEAQLAMLLQRCHTLNETVQSLNADQVAQVSWMDRWQDAEAGDDPYQSFANPSEPVPSLLYDGAFSQAAVTEPKALGTEAVDEERALEIALEYVGNERVQSVTAEQGLEGDIPCFGVAVETQDAGLLHLQITKTGGHVLMMTPETSPDGSNYSVDQCRQNALEFLTSRGYGRMEPSYYAVDFGMVTFNFVPVQDGVRLYPDLVKVQVSLESGQIIGVEANNYLRNHVQRSFETEILSEEEIRGLIHSLKIESIRPALIPKNAKELYCYEVRGTHEGTEYLIYLDAVTGEAQDILEVVAAEDGEEVV